MILPDLTQYAARYKELEHALDTLADADPASLLIAFPQATLYQSAITITFDELTAFCPWTKFPDQGSLSVIYTPSKYLLELKSFKYYMVAYRDRHITQEHLAEKILSDLNILLNPITIVVKLDYMPRGGLHTIIEVFK